jgi:TonB-dependent receptor
VGGPNIYDPSQFTLSQYKANETLQDTDQYTGKADIERPFDLGSSQLVVKAGVNLRWSDLDNSKLAPTYTPVAGTTLTMNNPSWALIGDANPDFLSHYDLGPSVSPFNFSNYAGNNLNLFTLNAAKTLSTDLAGDDSIKEDVYAGYLMGTWTWRHWTVIAGGRYEGTQDNSIGHQIPPTASADPTAYPELTYSSSYGEFMPGVLVRYEPTKRLVLRASWTNTLARPDTTYLAPTQNVDFQVNPTAANPDTVSGGNPALKAATSTNWDASADYYFPGIGIASVGAFYKAIDNPVYSDVYTGLYQGEPAVFTSYANASSAWVRGVEFEYQQNLAFLPGFLDGLNAYANLTLVNSSVHVPSDPGQEYSFFNQANKVANLGIAYQRGGFYGRLAYNWTGPYLFAIDSPTLAEYEAPFHTLDLITTYKFGGHWTLKFTANNLTGFPTRSYFNTPTLIDIYARDGRFFTVGANWSY